MKYQRRIKPKAFIICNGIKTEYQYFENLRLYLGRESRYLIDIIKIKGDPVRIINQILSGKASLKNFDPDLDEIFFVFDVDEFGLQNPTEFTKAIKEAIKHKIQLVWSNPSFEYWILLHFKENTNELTTKQCINIVNSEFKRLHLKEYSKNDNGIFEKLEPTLEVALDRSTVISSPKIGNVLKNPSTQVGKLIKLLK